MYLARFSYDALPIHRQRAIDFIRREVEAAHQTGLSARLLVPLTRSHCGAALQFEVELTTLDELATNSVSVGSARARRPPAGCIPSARSSLRRTRSYDPAGSTTMVRMSTGSSSYRAIHAMPAIPAMASLRDARSPRSWSAASALITHAPRVVLAPDGAVGAQRARPACLGGVDGGLGGKLADLVGSAGVERARGEHEIAEDAGRDHEPRPRGEVPAVSHATLPFPVPPTSPSGSRAFPA
jgi:hypothetical protein